MELQPLAASVPSSLREHRSFDSLLRAVWLSACGLLLLLCVFVALRRVSGGLQNPLPTASLLIVGLIAALTASGLRLFAINVAGAGMSPGGGWLRQLPPSLGLLCLAMALTLPGSSPGGLAVFWGVLVLEEAIWWYAGLGPLRRESHQPNRHRAAEDEREALPEDQHSSTTLPQLSLEMADMTAVLPPEATQYMTRNRTLDGGETISGLVRGTFQPGERTQNLHLSFCPPLAARPALETHQVEGPTAKIKRALVESYGARLEVRLLSGISRPESVVIRFDVTAEGISGE